MKGRDLRRILITIRPVVAGLVPERIFGWLMRAVYPRIETELRLVASWAPRGGTAVDVGAWYGPWSARLDKLADRLVIIEPNPVLARHLRSRFPDARVVEAAASDGIGTARLALPGGGRGAEGVASVEHAGKDSIPIRRVTIDSLGLTDVRFIKIDVEGHEMAALRGAEQTIRRSLPLLLLEVEARYEEVTRLLAQWGYQGSILAGRSWVPLSTVDLAALQRANADVARMGMLGRLARPGRQYPNLVLFRRPS
jgi:FkbM family methyltransferase